MLAVNSVISASIIDERTDFQNSLVVNHYVNIAKLIWNKIYIPDSNPFFDELLVSVDKLPQSVRTQFKNAIAHRRVKLPNSQVKNLFELKLEFESIMNLKSDWMDLLIVGETQGIDLGLKPGSFGSRIGEIEVAFGELVEQCQLISGTQLAGEFKKGTNREIIWKKVFVRDTEHAEFISIIDRYFFNVRNFSRADNSSRWFLSKIQENAFNCKSIKIFCQESEDLSTSSFRRQLEFIAKNVSIELILVPELVWKEQQHQRYIRYGNFGALIIDPGFDVLSELIPKVFVYHKENGVFETRGRHEWETRVQQIVKKVLVGSK